MIPKKCKEPKETEKNKIIALDPGLRTFMTGLSNKDCIMFGKGAANKLAVLHRRLNKLEKKDIPNKIKKKNELMLRRKILYKRDELQWKTIKYLTDNYNTIYLGDMSAKSIVKKNKSVLSNLQKKVCLSLGFYKFKQKLEYKCNAKKVNYKLVHECYTSKTCSLCGSYNKDLTNEKIYDCNKCNEKIDRDVNGCRNILMIGIDKVKIKAQNKVKK